MLYPWLSKRVTVRLSIGTRQQIVSIICGQDSFMRMNTTSQYFQILFGSFVVIVVVGDFRQRRRGSLPLLKSELPPRISAVTTITEDYPAADSILTKPSVHELRHNFQNSFFEALSHQEIHKFM